MYQYILFDVDGTLSDSREGITKSVQYALSKLGVEETDPKRLELYVGPPLIDSFTEIAGLSLEEARQGVIYYREYFSKYGIHQNRMFDGAPQMLEQLKAAGKVLATATCKAEPYLMETLKMFGLTEYFDYICGGSLDESCRTKDQVIAKVLRQMSLSEEEKKKVLMVGDRKHDVEGAAVHGIPCLGLSMGFAPEGELQNAGAIAVVDTLEEVVRFILGQEGCAAEKS